VTVRSFLVFYEDTVQTALAGYLPTGREDHTITALEAFVKHLPRDGARNTSDDILSCNSDEELRQLGSLLSSLHNESV